MAPLQQLNLKVSPAVLDHWRAQAAAQGLSVRDWLVSVAGPAAAPVAGDRLADRVALLETAAAELRDAVALLEAAPPRSPQPDPVAMTPPAAPVPLDPPPLPDRRLTPEEAAGLLPLRDVAEALGVVPSAITNWAARQAGKRAGNPAGAIYRGGHRLRGKGLLPGAVKPGWLFDRVAN